VVVYPAREPGDAWRAVWVKDGRRRYREAVTEARLAVKLEKVLERLSAGAANMERPGAELIAFYLSPDRLPADRQWSRKHAHTQARLCERFAAPVIGHLVCQDITAGHMQQIVNAAPTPGEGARARGMISALVGAGIAGGHLASPRLKEVHWQAGDRLLPPPPVTVAGEFVPGVQHRPRQRHGLRHRRPQPSHQPSRTGSVTPPGIGMKARRAPQPMWTVAVTGGAHPAKPAAECARIADSALAPVRPPGADLCAT